MPTNVISGAPGTKWTNDTGKVAYQFKVARANTCGLCFQFDGMIRLGSWPIPLHRNCRCVVELVYPNATAKPFTDFRETIRNLDEAQRNAVVGAYNLRLIEAGVVKWEDVVTASRMRDFTEVVSLKRLTVKDLTAVGVPKGRAEATVKAANSGPQVAADEARRRILAALQQRGIDAETVRRQAAERLAARVTSRPPQAPPPAANAAANPTPTAPPTLAALATRTPPVPLAPAAKVRFAAKDRSAYEAVARRVFGRDLPDAEAAALAGAPEGAEVTARAGVDNVVIAWEIPKVAQAVRRLYRDDNGKLVIQASYFEVDKKERGKGIGAEVFGRMVDAGVAAGVDRITTSAARAADQIGYRVWPLFGYDGKIPEALTRDLPPELAGAERVSDLMTTEGGRSWWANNGGTVSLAFDLNPNSLSQRIWRAYQAAKALTRRGRTSSS
jgi:GNAT superfamily N-acetyltransferase